MAHTTEDLLTLSRLPPFSPLPASQAEFLAERVACVVALSTYLRELRAELLRLGGVEVVLPSYHAFEPWQRNRDDYYSAAILQKGRAWRGDSAILEPGSANACHTNVAQAHLGGRGSIATGYALADDGLWREHSWILTPGPGEAGTIVETTAPWLGYFGYTLDASETRRFVRDELGPEAMP